MTVATSGRSVTTASSRFSAVGPSDAEKLMMTSEFWRMTGVKACHTAGSFVGLPSGLRA